MSIRRGSADIRTVNLGQATGQQLDKCLARDRSKPAQSKSSWHASARTPGWDAVQRDQRIVSEVGERIEADGAAALRIDDLRLDDLDRVDWAAPLHLAHVAAALRRVPSGEVEYLAVRASDGQPVSMGGIDFAPRSGAGTLWQLLTRPDLRGLGLGTRLIAEAEARTERRRCRWAVLGVEDNNPRARGLYERLGYVPFGSETESWLQEGPAGAPVLYETTVTLLRKRLSALPLGGLAPRNRAVGSPDPIRP